MHPYLFFENDLAVEQGQRNVLWGSSVLARGSLMQLYNPNPEQDSLKTDDRVRWCHSDSDGTLPDGLGSTDMMMMMMSFVNLTQPGIIWKIVSMTDCQNRVHLWG